MSGGVEERVWVEQEVWLISACIELPPCLSIAVQALTATNANTSSLEFSTLNLPALPGAARQLVSSVACISRKYKIHETLQQISRRN